MKGMKIGACRSGIGSDLWMVSRVKGRLTGLVEMDMGMELGIVMGVIVRRVSECGCKGRGLVWIRLWVGSI